MVKKGSKRGLNTGNTIRHCFGDPQLRQCQRYGCLVVSSEVAGEEAHTTVDDMFLSKGVNGIEFSLNKRKRWEVPEDLKEKIEDEQDSTHIKVRSPLI